MDALDVVELFPTSFSHVSEGATGNFSFAFKTSENGAAKGELMEDALCI
jgi:hypothetical protein